ncbi:MAG: YqiJ family protein [Spirochaetes bacterium]|nr:YqiJ family protein [Spirochaetota bacterium]MBU0955466.1 YqiJ family protein [Spirochaetota bacterium]
MSFIAFLGSSQNLVYTITLGFVVVLGLIELVCTLLGFSLSDAIDSLLPDFDLPDTAPSAAGGLLELLGFGSVPFVIRLLLFGFFFGISGYFLQLGYAKWTGRPMSAGLSLVFTLPLAFILSGLSAKLVSRIFPQIQTDALSIQSLCGSSGVITIGTASLGSPAEARVTGRDAKTYYVRVQPYSSDETFTTGTAVLLIELVDGIFFVQTAPEITEK